MDITPTIQNVNNVVDWIKSSGFKVFKVELFTNLHETPELGTLDDVIPTVTNWDYEGKKSSLLRAYRVCGRFYIFIRSGHGFDSHFEQHQGVGGTIVISFKDNRNINILKSFMNYFWNDAAFGFVILNPKLTPVCFTSETFIESGRYFNKSTFYECLKTSCVSCNRKTSDKLFDDLYGSFINKEVAV